MLQQQQQWQASSHDPSQHSAPPSSQLPATATSRLHQQNTDAALVKVALEIAKINIIDLNNKYVWRIRVTYILWLDLFNCVTFNFWYSFAFYLHCWRWICIYVLPPQYNEAPKNVCAFKKFAPVNLSCALPKNLLKHCRTSFFYFHEDTWVFPLLALADSKDCWLLESLVMVGCESSHISCNVRC